MTFTLDAWQVLTIAFTVIGFVAAVIKYAIGHMLTIFNERRKAVSENNAEQAAKIEKLETDLQSLYREFLRFQTELSNSYIKRDDYVMTVSQIQSKLDSIAFTYQRGMNQ